METPDNANDGCVGPSSENAGKVSACDGCPNQSACASGANSQSAATTDTSIKGIADRMSNIKHKLLVLSGKGGVGKSTISAQLAFTLAMKGYQVGLLDVDICGPSIPQMLGLVGEEVHQSASGWSPVYVEDNLGVMSIGFMLPKSDDAVIWRGPRKNGLIKQFLLDVDWGNIDYLIIDTPPGTSDEHISMVQYLKESNVDGAVVVTTPQEVAMADVRKELNFCKKTGLQVLGVVENMAEISFKISDTINDDKEIYMVDENGENVSSDMLSSILTKCPELEKYSFKLPVFNTNTAMTPELMAEKFDVPYLGKLPLDPNLTRACEAGESFLQKFPTSSAASHFNSIVEKVINTVS